MSSSSRKIRWMLGGVAVFGAFFLSPWIPLAIMVLLSFRYPAWEVLFIGMFVDFLWLPAGSFPFFTALALVLVWAFEPIRSRYLFP